MASLFSLLALFLLVNLTETSIQVSADIVFEDGYTVSTVLDGNKLGINPHSVLPLPGSSDLIILDSSASTFYTVSFSTPQDSVIKPFAGNGIEGFSDGDSASAMFKKPKSFAVDLKGNVYVADRNNHAIRKISKSGVTTIAGGYSNKTGHVDGPAQNASFSPNFELAFIPERCALMVSDSGNQLVRQINLKVEDCARGSQSGVGMASVWVWALGLGVSCLLGLVVGFVIRPYVIPHEGSSHLCFSETWKHCLIRLGRQESSSHLCFSETWKHCLISLGRQVPILCFDIRSAVVSSTLYALLKRLIELSLSHLSLMFRLNIVEGQTLREKSVSLLDSDDLSRSEILKSEFVADQLKGLISLNGGLELSDTSNKIFEQQDKNGERSVVSSGSHGKIDNMIQANIMGFAEQTKRNSVAESLESSSGLVKRR